MDFEPGVSGFGKNFCARGKGQPDGIRSEAYLPGFGQLEKRLKKL
jgi:hypothetical protein